MRTIRFDLGDRLEKAREGISTNEMAALLGVSRQTVANYESGRTVPTRAMLLAWAAICDTTLEELAGWAHISTAAVYVRRASTCRVREALLARGDRQGAA